MRQALGSLLFAVMAVPAVAQEALPDFATCMDIEVARYERALKRLRAGSGEEVTDIAGTGLMEVCGTIGIMLCDDADDPLGCQYALARQQDALNAAVQAGLPTPEAVAGRDGDKSDALYPSVLTLSRGTSAGPDCDGTTPVMAAWCEAHEATLRLSTSLLAWQVARYLDAAEDAVTAGWARVPPPTRPVARPQEAAQ